MAKLLMRAGTLALAVLAACGALAAQGSRADYERAAKLPQRAAGLVVNARVEATWAEDGRSVSFSIDDASGPTSRRTVALDPGSPSSQPTSNPESRPSRAEHRRPRPADAHRDSPSPSDDVAPDRGARVDIRDGAAFIVPSSGPERLLARAPGAGATYGRPVYWSPDGSRVVITRYVEGYQHQIYIVESTPREQFEPQLHSIPYLKPGDRIPQAFPVMFDSKSGDRLSLDESLYATPWQIEDQHWMADSREFSFVYNQRGHQFMRMVGIDRAGHARSIVEEQQPTFIDYAHKAYWHEVEATGEIIWTSERDGYNHLWMFHRDRPKSIKQITRGTYVVRGVDRVDEAARQIWFHAGGIRPGQNPYYVHYCRVNFDGTGLVVLTEGDGTHEAPEFSPDGRTFVDRWSRIDQPPVTEIRRALDGTLVREVVRADWSRLLATGWKPPQSFVARGRDGKTDIYGVIFRPTNHDPGRKYPIVESIYAGPQSSYVPTAFHEFYGEQQIAELGFIVVKIDGMGTSNRSKDFHDVCWKNLVDAGFPDRIPWIRAAAAQDPSMDLTRVGIYGGSAGGQNALGALLHHGDFYQVAVADCGCHDNRMDKMWWNELWMGWPIGPEYRDQSNVTHAYRLQGKLLLIVGEMDQNVDPASTMQVVNALVKADKDFDLLVIPGAGHGAAGTPYGHRRLMDFLVRNLLHVEPRHE